jgi:hypothetical protein
MKRLFLVILIFIIILALILSLYFLGDIQKEKLVDVGLKMSLEDVSYNKYKESKSLGFDLIGIDRNYQHAIENGTGQNWSTIIYRPYDNDKTKLASILLLDCELAYTSLEHTFISYNENISYNKNITDEEWLKINITRLNQNNISKENILKVIENLKIIENFYLDKGLDFVQTSINRLEFLYNYINKIDFPKDDFTIQFQGFTGNTSFIDATKITINYYNSIYDSIMTKIDLLEAKNKTIAIRNIGLTSLDTTGLAVNVDYAFLECKWSNPVVSPGSTTFCILNNSCTGKEVEITYIGGSKKFNCSS